MISVTRAQETKVLGITFALLNVALWYSVPAIRSCVDALAGRSTDGNNPIILNGVQELLVYFDPWLARGVFPIVYTLGLAAIPFLAALPQNEDSGPTGSATWSFAVVVLLLAFETVWLFLIAVGVFLRGPNWNLFWPGEPWDPKVVPLNMVNMSDYFWVSWLGQVPPTSWEKRECAGLIFLNGYFMIGLFLGLVVTWSNRRELPLWRRIAFIVLVLFAALVPIKMYLRWAFNLKYLIYVPEYWLNF